MDGCNIHAPGGVRTHNLSRRAAVDLRLGLRSQWDRQGDTVVLFFNSERLYLHTVGAEANFVYVSTISDTYTLDM
jgi:hypothetical protein